MAQPKSKLIIMVVINTAFFIAISAYGMITLLSGIYFRKIIGYYGLISTIRIGKNWLTVGAVVLVVFSIFYLCQIILLAVNYYRLLEQNQRMKQERSEATKEETKKQGS